MVIVASLLLALANPAAGILALLAGSALLMLRSYRKEWPVSRLTCLMPPLSAVLCLGVQLAALPAVSSAPLVSGAIVLGLFLGFLAGKGHRVFARDGRVFARRTFLYLLIWMVCLLVAQGGGLWQNESATGWGLGVSFFSSAMIIALSAVLFGKYRTQRRSLQAAQAPVAKLAIVLAVLAFFGASTSFANLPAGTYEGPLDPEGLAILKSRYQIDVSSSAAAVQIQSDGSAILLHEVVFEIQGSTKYVFSPLAASAPGVWGMGRCRVTESYPDGRRPAEEAKEENFHLDESPQSDGAYLLWLPNVVMVPLEFGSGMDMRGREFPWRVHLVGAMPGGSGSAAGSRIGAIPTSPEELVGQIRQRLQASGISEDAVKAGVVAALLLLLAGASTSVAQSLALAVAAQTQDRIRPPGEPTYSGDGRILSGQQARDWLAGRNLCRDGQLTDDFWRGWHDQPWSRQDAPHPFGLQAIAGNWRRDQPLGDDVTIIIDNPVPPEPLPELPPPLVNAD